MVSATRERQVLDAPGRPATVLVVEEHDLVRAAVAAALARAGYVVLCAESGEQALRLVARYGAAVDLVLAAVVLPGFSGPILAGRLLATRRARRALFMSGYSGDDLARHGVCEWGDGFLAKPFTPHALVRRVREALGR